MSPLQNVRRAPWAVWSSVVFLLLAAGCSSDARTQLLVIVDADSAVQARAETLRVQIRGEAGGQVNELEPIVYGDDEAIAWPRRIVVTPKDGDADRTVSMRIDALESGGGSGFVGARVVAPFEKGKTRVVRVVLEEPCIHVSCGEEQTCFGGECVDPQDAWPVEPYGQDASVRDAGAMDAGSPDAGKADAGPADAAPADSAPMDGSQADGATPDASTSDAGTDGGTIPSCDTSTHSCVARPPSDWSGPVAMGEVSSSSPDTLPQCGDPFPTREVDIFRDLEPGAHVCDCECSSPSGYDCSEAALKQWHETDCVDFPNGDYAAPGSCEGSSAPDGTYVIDALPDVSGGSCDAAPRATTDTPMWGTRARLCASDSVSDQGCAASEVCAPNPPSELQERFCIYRVGDHPCPSGSYSSRMLHYQGYTDDRSCSDCACQPTGTCGDRVNIWYTDDTCSSTPDVTLTPNACEFLDTPPGTWQWEGPNSVSCTVTNESTASGSVTPTGPLTVCCN
jgi:hypothetical protein